MINCPIFGLVYWTQNIFIIVKEKLHTHTITKEKTHSTFFLFFLFYCVCVTKKKFSSPATMTLPTITTQTNNSSSTYDDSDMFGPPRSSPMRSNRPKVPMISAKLRMREERKRVLQLCAHKLEKMKDSETNLRRSVCIHNTYSRLTDEVRREKQNKLLANLPK